MKPLTIEEIVNERRVNSLLKPLIEDEYYVSEYCNIYSKKRGNFKKLTVDKRGYITIKDAGKRVEKFVMKAFFPTEKELKYVKYKDGNIKNIHYTNLEWTDKRPSYHTNNDNKILRVEEIVFINGEETVKDVEVRYYGYDGYYISEYGKPYSLKCKKLAPIRIHKRKSGFDFIELHLGGTLLIMDTNIAVAKAFIPTEKELPYVLFKDGNVFNKHYTNLYWSESVEKEDLEFKILPGFSSYKFNNRGVGKSYKGKYPKFLSPCKDNRGYYVYMLVNDKGEVKCVRRNRIVATIFLENPKNKPEVDHRNRKRWDDRVENLKWSTRKENMDNVDKELKSLKSSTRIGKFDQEGNLLEEYKNAYEAAASFDTEDNLNIPAFLRQCARKNENLDKGPYFTSCGQVWKYIHTKYKYQLLSDEVLFPIKNEEIDSKYFITNHFNIINKKGYKILLQNNGGYPSCTLSTADGQKSMLMHRLVAIFFVPGRTDEMNIVHHKDENKMNFHPSNLEWTNTQLNLAYSGYQKEKIVHQYDRNTGEYIQSFPSSLAAAKSIENSTSTIDNIRHCISSIARTKVGSCSGYVWRYSESSGEVPGKVDVTSKKKAIDQFTLEGKFIKRYESVTSAMSENDCSNVISACCRGEKPQALGYIWKFADVDIDPSDIIVTQEKEVEEYPNCRLIQSTCSNVYIKTFDNILVASKELNISAKRINNSCIGKFKTINRFIFKYEQ